MDFLTINFLIVISILILLSGIVVFWIQITILLKSIKTYDWTETIARITKSELEVNEDMSGKWSDRTYRPLINYTYKINKVEFESDKIYYGDSIYTSNKWQIRRFLKRFPVNKEITVYINPLNERDSIMLRGVRAANITYLVISILIIGIGVFGLIYNKNINEFLIILKTK